MENLSILRMETNFQLLIPIFRVKLKNITKIKHKNKHINHYYMFIYK